MRNSNYRWLRNLCALAALTLALLGCGEGLVLGQEQDLDIGRGLSATTESRALPANKHMSGKGKRQKRDVTSTSNRRLSGGIISLTSSRSVAKVEPSTESTEAQVYRHLIEQNPDDASMHASFAYMYYKSGNFEEAIPQYQRALELRPDAFWSHQLGHSFYKLGHHREAIESLEQAVKLNPEYNVSHYDLALAYLAQGNKKEALKQFAVLKASNRQLAAELLKSMGKR